MKLRDGVGNRIKDKLNLLKTRKGYRMLIADVLFPSREREKNRKIVGQHADILDRKINGLEPLIRSLRSHIDYIGDTADKYVAAYLLIGRAFTSIKAVVILVRQGYSFQIVETVRSSMEALNLAALFLEEGQEKLLKKWFGGETVTDRTARVVLDAAVNKMSRVSGGVTHPMREAQSDIYSIYSSYTHSGYVALFDFIDVFTEDFDFEQYTQFYYSRRNLQLIDNLYVNILLGLKNFYIRSRDEENLAQVEALLKNEGESFASKEEIGRQMERYNK